MVIAWVIATVKDSQSLYLVGNRNISEQVDAVGKRSVGSKKCNSGDLLNPSGGRRSAPDKNTSTSSTEQHTFLSKKQQNTNSKITCTCVGYM